MYQVIVQRAVSQFSVPGKALFKRWASAALSKKISQCEVTIRIVDKQEMTTLNATYRHKNKPTNVLSFPFDMPTDIELETHILGDIVMCAEVIIEEAKEQKKRVNAHWAHMTVHGILHLLGYDHEKNEDADIMEAEEIKILKELKFESPY